MPGWRRAQKSGIFQSRDINYPLIPKKFMEIVDLNQYLGLLPYFTEGQKNGKKKNH